MKSVKLSFGTIIVIGFTLLLICASATSSMAWEPKDKYLTVYAGSLGGGWYPVGTLTAELIKKEVPALSTKPGPGGGIANAKMVESGRGKLGMCFTSTAAQAYKGIAPFKKPGENIRHLISMYRLPYVWVTRKESDIKTVADLKDKRISPAKVGQTTYALSQTSLEVYGMSFESIKKSGGLVNILGDKERINMLKDKHLDAIACMFPLNHANFLGLQVTPGIKLVSMDEKHTKMICDANPGIAPLVIEPGTPGAFKNIKEPVHTVMGVVNLICRADMEDELAYYIAKAVYENRKAYVQYVPSSDLVMATPTIGAKTPIHPGAMKFYKEKGLDK